MNNEAEIKGNGAGEPAISAPRVWRPPGAEVTQIGSSLRPPSIPDHELLVPIGQGSYGEVWLARNVLAELRAVKVIYRSRFTDPRPFEREFGGIQRFEPISRSHPSQLAILHVGKNDAAGCFYYVMELADAVPNPDSNFRGPKEIQNPNAESVAERGENRALSFGLRDWDSYTPHTLRHDLDQHHGLPISDCVEIGLSLITALAHLHRQGLVHRDIKPSNVIFVKNVPKLADIGLVTDAGDTQSIVGTEGYIPPEGPGTPQADVFSLGRVLYETSTGLDRRRFPELPNDLRDWRDRKEVVEFNEILLKACAKDVARRYRSAEEMRADLELLRRGESVKRKHAWRRTLRRAKSFALVATSLAVAAAGLYALAVWTSGQPALEWSKNEEANRAYRIGVTVFHENAEDSFQRAAESFKRAVDLDPKFARANARLARSITWNGPSDPDNLVKARPFAYKALALNPQSDEAHCAVASIKTLLEHDWRGAEQHHLKAIALNPKSEDNLYTYASFLSIVGRTDEAIQQVEKAMRLESRSRTWMQNAAFVFLAARQYDRAIETVEDIIAESPSRKDYLTRGVLVPAYVGKENYPKAIELAEASDPLLQEKPDEVKAHYAALQKAYDEGGVLAYWQQLLQANRKGKTDLVWWAVLQARVGDKEKALQHLAEALRTMPTQLAFQINREPGFDGLRSDPRFKEILQKLGLGTASETSFRRMLHFLGLR